MDESAARPLALITGASSGLGRAYAVQLAAAGWDLIPVARREERLEALAAEIRATSPVRVEPLVADLTDPAGLAAAEARIAQGVGLVVNSAGFAGYMPFATLPPEVADDLVAIHVRAVTRLTRAAVAVMLPRRDGAIINVASLLAFSESVSMGRFARATYAGCKAYIVTFTQLVAQEVAAQGIRVQVCCPGAVATEFHDVAGMARPVAAMSADDVVAASLHALEVAETVCVPALEDAGVVERYHDAQRQMLAQGNLPALAARYRPPAPG
ncbi:MAG: SDR family NAD(P)-dependent oxidoreductase [Candidatus Dormibacteria bacterium]|jgi:short-subunit dehydrogenase